MIKRMYDEGFFDFRKDSLTKPFKKGKLSDTFGYPPFSILGSAKQEWQDRKQSWISLGIQSELGRHSFIIERIVAKQYDHARRIKDTSIFDPVLCELIYRWFCPEGGQIVDPFAGGSVRGIVAGFLGYKYWGCDLNSEQIEANNSQAKSVNPQIAPIWIHGDSLEKLDESPKSDLVLTCPPYGNLEKYTDDPRDLSNMNWEGFSEAYRKIIHKTIERMKDDSFACFVVGDFRDSKGYYRSFPGLTIEAFKEKKARLYNEMILVTPAGTACLRTGQFRSNRKLVKIHQNVLIFCKGDWNKAVKKFSDFKARQMNPTR